EEKMLMARDTARDEAQKLHRKWLKHQAFMAELARNKEWLAKIEQEGQELIQEKPELRSVVQQKLEEIRECWSDLENTTKAKARQLFENNKPEPAVKSYSDLDNQLSHLEQQPPQLEQAHHLPTFNEQLQKFQGLMAGDREGGEQSGMVETRIVRLIEPLKERRRILLASKEMHQVAQDLEDEILWIQERLPVASCKDYGNNLQSVQQHVKKNQRELTGRRARVEEVLDRAGIIASLRTPEVEFVREGAGHVRQLWEVLQLETERRSVMLDAALQSQQYYSEAAKVESWLSGQKLHLVSEEKGTDESSTLQLLKAHLALEQTVETYAETVGMLSQQCQRLLELGHPEEQITKQQSHIDRLYVSLKDMVEHRKTKLEQQYWLYQLNKEVEELEKWITEREVVASSTDLGQDLEDVTVLEERFTKFASETNNIGQQRMEQVNKMVNEMIDCGHTDAATIAEWKDGLNESWADLLELMETRRQMLAASHQLHKFFTDCKEIAGKMKQLPEVRACQANITNPATLQRLMHSFEHALQLLVAQVRQLQENAAQLRTIYAGEKAEAIMVKEQEVMEAWKELLSSCEASRVQVTSVTDKVQFFSVVRENLMWMEGIMGQIGWDDLTALEGMMKQHQELKAKVDGRSKTIQQCADLGKILIAAGNPASEEQIKEKLDSLLSKQKDLVEKWDKHQEKLQRQEKFQFAQETVKAEAWLKAKEPLITSREPEGGEAQAQTDEAEQLILRHEAFRKAAVTWKERFSSLRQGIMDPKMAYAWQHLKADFMQPRINHIHKAVNPLLEASRVQREQFGDIPMADMMGPESGLELLHGRLQRDPRGSRSDPQMDHLRREREYKLGRQTSSEQEIQARLNELPMIVRQERYRRRLERQSSSEQEGSGKQRLQRQDSSDLEGSIKEGSDEKRSTMAEIVEQVQEREAAHARGEPYRPPSSLSAPVTRFDGRPRARDRPKPRRRPRPKEPEETRRSRSAPATGAPTTPQPPSHTAHNEGSLYRKKATSSDLEAQQRSPNKSWVNVYCVLKEGMLTFYKDARNHNTTYNGEPPVDLSNCTFDPSMGYKKKKNVFILEDLKAWTSNITTCITEHEAMAKWDKPGTSSMDPDRSERKEKSEGDADARSERSELVEGEERSEKERSEKGDGSEKLDTSEIADKIEGGAGGSSTSGKSK
uniref:Spectrin beta chain, non-erythrocytic 4-like n=1 Tax=Seriola dumerili TaxID=41447 RepID=A0A3B4VD74_SERDU